MAKQFDYTQASELAGVFSKFKSRYLFIEKSAAIILGFPDTTQDADLFVMKEQENCRLLVEALIELGFTLDKTQKSEILRGKDFIQIRNGPFDMDLVFAPDGIETYDDAWRRSVIVEGLPVCHIDDIIRSKRAAGRVKDKESLPRLEAFRDWWVEEHRNGN